MHIRRQWLHNIWWISKVEKNIQLWKLSELNSNLVTSLISVDSLTAFSSSQILQLVWMGMKDKETCTHTILTAVFFQVNQGYWRRRADMKGVTPLPLVEWLEKGWGPVSDSCWLATGRASGHKNFATIPLFSTWQTNTVHTNTPAQCSLSYFIYFLQ